MKVENVLLLAGFVAMTSVLATLLKSFVIKGLTTSSIFAVYRSRK